MGTNANQSAGLCCHLVFVFPDIVSNWIYSLALVPLKSESRASISSSEPSVFSITLRPPALLEGTNEASFPLLSLLLRAFTSRPMASLLSVASSSSRCSFLRLALMRWDSSSASSSCLLSCLTLAFTHAAAVVAASSSPHSAHPEPGDLVQTGP